VFVGRQGDVSRLYIRDLSELVARPIAHTDGAQEVFLSPDGRSAGFWLRTSTVTGVLKRVPLDGGEPAVEIARTRMCVGASWGEDDSIVFTESERGGLWRVSTSGGTPEAITTPAPGEYSHRLPHVLPGARAVVFTVLGQISTWGTARIAVHRFGTKEWNVVVRGAADARYLPTGHLIYFRHGQMMALPFDLERLTATGIEVGLFSDVMQAANHGNYFYDSGAAQVAVSTTGTLAYLAGGQIPDSRHSLVWVNRRGEVEPLSLPEKPYLVPRLSPDGRRVAVETIQTEKRIWVHDLRVPGSLDPITKPDVAAAHPVWLDSQRLAFSGYADGRPSILFGRADKSEPPESVVSSAFQTYPASWTRDGQLLYVAESPTTNMDIWTLSAGGGSPNGTEWLATEAVEKMAQISPDGQWLAYATNESGATEVYVRRYPGRADRQKLTTGGGDQPVWSRNGRELFYLRGPSDNRELVVHDVGAGGAVAPTGRVLFRLAPLRLTGYDPVPGFDVTPDGQRFVFPRHPDTSPPPLTDRIHIVQNWFEELKEKAPRQ